MSDLTVLLSSAGRRGALLKLLRQGGEQAGVSVRALATDCSPLSAAGHLADDFYLVPRVDSEDYLESMLDLVRRHRIEVIVPTIDTELALLSANRELFEQAGAAVVVSSPEVIEICADKRRSSAWLAAEGHPVPIQYSLDQLDGLDADHWPLFFKPVQGSSSVGAHPVNSVADVSEAIARFGDGVIEELAEGPEFTVDCWVDAEGSCRAVVPRRRLSTRTGETAKGQTVADEAVEATARAVVEALPGARGSISVQIIKSAAGPKVIEINPRFAGGYPLTHAAGAAFTAALVAEVKGKPVDPEWFSWKSDLVMLRYDDAVFVAADDLPPIGG